MPYFIILVIMVDNYIYRNSQRRIVAKVMGLLLIRMRVVYSIQVSDGNILQEDIYGRRTFISFYSYTPSFLVLSETFHAYTPLPYPSILLLTWPSSPPWIVSFPFIHFLHNSSQYDQTTSKYFFFYPFHYTTLNSISTARTLDYSALFHVQVSDQ